MRYPNAVPASLPMVDKAVAGDPNIYPPAAALAGYFTIAAVPQDAARARSRMWTRFKTGH